MISCHFFFNPNVNPNSVFFQGFSLPSLTTIQVSFKQIAQLFLTISGIEAYNDLSFQVLKNIACKPNYPYNEEIQTPEQFIYFPWSVDKNLDFYNIHFYTNLIHAIKDVNDKTVLITNKVT